MIPLNLTSNDQSMLAELCTHLRGWLYAQAAQGYPYAPPLMSPQRLEEGIADIMERFSITPHRLSELYDKLHRTGANA